MATIRTRIDTVYLKDGVKTRWTDMTYEEQLSAMFFNIIETTEQLNNTAQCFVTQYPKAMQPVHYDDTRRQAVQLAKAFDSVEKLGHVLNEVREQVEILASFAGLDA